MSLALDTLAGETAAGRRVAVLGTMAELGAESDAYHEQMGRQARAVASFIVGVGDGARLYRPDVWFENSEACAEHVSGLVKDTDCVLVKGSASVELGKVVARLRESSSPGGSA
jgi:UDP-N-acetylmuramoyl-tripeptide--D-alanyl-D-alanine ligase